MKQFPVILCSYFNYKFIEFLKDYMRYKDSYPSDKFGSPWELYVCGSEIFTLLK